MNNVKLTMFCEHGGCAAKANAESLDQILNLWKVKNDDKVIIGLQDKDDVGCYALGNEYLLVHTIDAITPVIDDAFAFGNIAVSHALSDIYSKGASPISALNLFGIPSNISLNESLKDIIFGCSEKLTEAGVVLLGGHTISTSELLVGFAVTGIADPKRIISIRGAHPGDDLILTKALGTGIISTALKLSNLDTPGISIIEEELLAAVTSMISLNCQASKMMVEFGASACTDVSGFGLLGHLSNMINSSEVGACIYYSAIPKLPGAIRLLRQGVAPVRLDENIRYFYTTKVSLVNDIDSGWPILFCPETSGGLLIAIREGCAQEFLDNIIKVGVTECKIIGKVLDDPGCKIIIDN